MPGMHGCFDLREKLASFLQDRFIHPPWPRIAQNASLIRKRFALPHKSPILLLALSWRPEKNVFFTLRHRQAPPELRLPHKRSGYSQIYPFPYSPPSMFTIWCQKSPRFQLPEPRYCRHASWARGKSMLSAAEAYCGHVIEQLANAKF